MTDLRSNIRRLYGFSGSYMLLILLPILIPFLKSHSLSMAEIFQLQAAFALSVMVFEVPSGYIADIWGRKRCLLIGGCCNGIAYAFAYWGGSYWEFMSYQVLLGIAASMYSGADVALLYDSLEELGATEGRKHQAVGNILAIRSVAEAAAAIFTSLLMVFASLKAVLVVQLVVGWLPFLIALSLQEVRVRTPIHSHVENFHKMAKLLLCDSKILRYIALSMTLWGMATFYAVWLFQEYWLQQGVSLASFGWLWALYNITVAITSKLSHRLERSLGSVKLLLFMAILPIIAYFSMSVIGGAAGVALGLLFQVSRGIHQVTLKNALNKRVGSSMRATVNSMISFGFRASFFLTGPLVGLSVDYFGLNHTLAILGGVFALLFLVLILPFLLEIRKAGSSAS